MKETSYLVEIDTESFMTETTSCYEIAFKQSSGILER